MSASTELPSGKATTDLGWEGQSFTYTPLAEPLLTAELVKHAGPVEVVGAHAVTFQPAGPGNQDRYAVQDWDVPGGTWRFMGVFDGHAGDETVSHLVETLPAQLQRALADLLAAEPAPDLLQAVPALLEREVRAYDEALARALFDIFPGGLAEVERMSDAEIRARMDDGGPNAAVAARCRSGSTVLIALQDPAGENLWVASVGDCNAILGVETAEGFELTVMDTDHNAANAGEQARVRAEHPGEDECLTIDKYGGRVIGIAITRAVGDQMWKLPVAWTRRVLLNSGAPPKFSAITLEAFLERLQTPPYLSNVAEVRHIALPPLKIKSDRGDGAGRAFLMMSSDGLYNLRPEGEIARPVEHYARAWVRAAARARGGGENMALAVLREALGGEDEAKVAAMMTVEMEGKWTDDVTVVVRAL